MKHAVALRYIVSAVLVGDVLATTADVLFYCFRGSSANISHVTQTLLLVDVTSDSRSCSKESWILCVCVLCLKGQRVLTRTLRAQSSKSKFIKVEFIIYWFHRKMLWPGLNTVCESNLKTQMLMSVKCTQPNFFTEPFWVITNLLISSHITSCCTCMCF